jgi:hypothetical protein
VKRTGFTAGLAGAASLAGLAATMGPPALGAPGTVAVGSRTTLDALLATVPPVAPRAWVQYVMGSGVRYLKKIGYGADRTSLGKLAFIETQIGSDEAACNPNTVKKSYLKTARYGDLLQPHDISRYVMKAGTTFLLVNATRADTLWLLDEDNLYSPHPARVTDVGRETVVMRKRSFTTRRVTLAFDGGGKQALRTMTLWLTPAIPNGVAKLHATIAGGDPFDLRIDAFGGDYSSLVDAPFDALRQTAT